MSSTLDAPYTWGKMRKGLKDNSETPEGILNTFCKERWLGGEGELFAPISRPLGKYSPISGLFFSFIQQILCEEPLCARP